MSNILEFKTPREKLKSPIPNKNCDFISDLGYDLESTAFALMSLKKSTKDKLHKEHIQKVLDHVAVARNGLYIVYEDSLS